MIRLGFCRALYSHSRPRFWMGFGALGMWFESTSRVPPMPMATVFFR